MKTTIPKIMKNNAGQALPYFLSLMVILILSWAMLINVAKLLKDRMMMQNAADNAALSMATNQARTMNILMEINAMIARYCYEGEPFPIPYVEEHFGPLGLGAVHPFFILSGSSGNFGNCKINYALFNQGIGRFIPSIADNASKITGLKDILDGKYYCGHGTLWGTPLISKHTKFIYDGVSFLTSDAVQVAVARVGPLNSHVVARHVARYQEVNSKGEPTGADEVLPVLPIQNPMTMHLEPNRQIIQFYGARHGYFSLPPIPPFFDGKHFHFVYPEPIGRISVKSWYYADRDNFYKKKVTLVAHKGKGSDSNKGYPFFGKWIGITWPSIQATASACYYNKGGPGFVLKNPPFNDERIRENIEAYWEGKKEGWKAHLVPVNQPLILH